MLLMRPSIPQPIITHHTLFNNQQRLASSIKIVTIIISNNNNNKLRVIRMDAGGLDSEGRQFSSAEEMWKEQIGGTEKEEKKAQWYAQGVEYWKVVMAANIVDIPPGSIAPAVLYDQNSFVFAEKYVGKSTLFTVHIPKQQSEGVEATVDGVLGGYGDCSQADIKGSEVFLNELLSNRFADGGRNQHLVALDCGAGIGRITKNLLIRYFNEVDLLEPVSHFLEAAHENLSPENLMLKDSHTASNFYCVPLQEFTPDAGRYDVIWVQWCIGHLADDDFVSFFKRAKVGLKPGGFFVLKENIASTGFVLDKEDRSITRSDSYFKELFNRCGLHLYKSKDQKGFPKELFAVKIYALTPDLPKRTRTKTQNNRPCIIR